MKIIVIKGNKGRSQAFFGGFRTVNSFIYHIKAPKKRKALSKSPGPYGIWVRV